MSWNKKNRPFPKRWVLIRTQSLYTRLQTTPDAGKASLNNILLNHELLLFQRRKQADESSAVFYSLSVMIMKKRNKIASYKWPLNILAIMIYILILQVTAIHHKNKVIFFTTEKENLASSCPLCYSLITNNFPYVYYPVCHAPNLATFFKIFLFFFEPNLFKQVK